MVEARNFTYLFYGFLAAWVIVLVYVISLARRGTRLKKELEEVRHLFGASDESTGSVPIEDRVR